MATNQEKIKQLIELRKTAQLGGGEKAIAKQHEKEILLQQSILQIHIGHFLITHILI